MRTFFITLSLAGLILLFSGGVCAETGNDFEWYADTMAVEDDTVYALRAKRDTGKKEPPGWKQRDEVHERNEARKQKHEEWLERKKKEKDEQGDLKDEEKEKKREDKRLRKEKQQQERLEEGDEMRKELKEREEEKDS